MKKCKECFVEKELDDFPKAKSCVDGHTNKCKKCTVVYQKQWAIDNPDKANKPLPEYRKEAARIRARKWYADNKEVAKLKSKKWRQENPERFDGYRKTWNDKNKDHKYLYVQNYRINNPIKYNAHRQVRYAVVTGELVSPNQCSACGANDCIVAHHDDYSKPLLVRWLCQKCHIEWHSKNKALNNDQ